MRHQRTPRSSRHAAASRPASAARSWARVALGVVLSGSFLVAQSTDAPPLNILLIMADDMGLQLGCYGDKTIRTPHLDGLAARGRLFENAYVTAASCSPSRSTIFTGLYPSQNGMYGLHNASKEFGVRRPIAARCLPILLQEAGYRTALFGKLHVRPSPLFKFQTRARLTTRNILEVAQHSGRFMRRSKKKFFLMVSWDDPHRLPKSYKPQKEYRWGRWAGAPEKPFPRGTVPPMNFHRLEQLDAVKRTTGYYNACMRLDEGIGLLLKELEDSGHADNTLVLFVSDHGPPFFPAKTTCYEAGVKVPMILRWPKVFDRGDRTKALVSSADIFPTILEAAGVQLLPGRPGRSLRHTADPKQHRKYLATEANYHRATPFYPRRAIRGSRYKLIHNLRAGKEKPQREFDQDTSFVLSQAEKVRDTDLGKAYAEKGDPPEFELFDLEADPWEFRNLATSAAHRDHLERLKRELLAWRKTAKDPLLTADGMAAMAKLEKPRTPGKK